MEGGKKKQNVGLIRDQSLRPTDTLIRVYYNQIDRLLKDIQADKGAKGAQPPNNFPPQATELY